LKQMKYLWMALAIIFVVVAATSLWERHYDAAFVTATLGALAWFLNYRANAKELISRANQEDGENIESEDEE